MLALQRTVIANPSVWEWRAFTAKFEPLKIGFPETCEFVDETFVVSPGSSARMAIRGNTLTVDRLDQQRDGLDLWTRALAAPFPLCQRDVRDALRLFPVAIPALYRPEYSQLAFVTDVATCTNGLRVAGARSVRRQAPLDGCVVERAAVSIAGRTLQTVAVTSPDPTAVSRTVHNLQLDRFIHRNIVETIKELLGVDAHAYSGADR